MSIESSMNPALLASLNGPKSSGARPLCLLPALDGVTFLNGYTCGPLWTPFSFIGGAKNPNRTMAALLGEFPQQTSLSEWQQMTAGYIDATSGQFVQPAPTPVSSSSSAMMMDMG